MAADGSTPSERVKSRDVVPSRHAAGGTGKVHFGCPAQCPCAALMQAFRVNSRLAAEQVA